MMSWFLKLCCIKPSDGELEAQEITETVMCDPDIVASKDVRDVVPGTSFYVYGVILRTCERFSINLVLDTPKKDIALHLNPRLPQNYIVRNCKINGCWGKEEVASPLAFNLHRGDKFSVQILVTECEYLISINGRHFETFRHRLPYEKVNYIQVRGDVTNIKIDQTTVNDYPDLMESKPGLIPFTNNFDLINFNEQNNQNNKLEIPFYGLLPHKFTRGYRIHIRGRVKLLPHSFFINLQSGTKKWPHPIIPFHLNPRFANTGGKHVICRNSWINSKWDREERTEISIDFLPGKDFLLTIISCDSSYKIQLNEKLIAEYKFRISDFLVDTIYIQGDLHLFYVIMEENLNSVDDDLIEHNEY